MVEGKKQTVYYFWGGGGGGGGGSTRRKMPSFFLQKTIQVEIVFPYLNSALCTQGKAVFLTLQGQSHKILMHNIDLKISMFKI
jgi:hypothetical protein